MHRKDRVYEALRSLCDQRAAQEHVLRRDAGFSAEEVAERAEIDRTNASRDLNALAQEGTIERIPGRPVLFTVKASGQESDKETHPEQNQQAVAKPTDTSFAPASMSVPDPQLTVAASTQIGASITSFETLIGNDQGLKVAVQQAKAAIIYPPRGLHTLLYGPSGVGKTTLARLMHTFALELKALAQDAPFVSFNCADYAGNPQLLMAHLFGVVRGAYTGAERDRAGLVEQADHGILFLDEVHRLPPEGQEMLFYLMDRERFRRLGDAQERRASLLLLAATTEDPNTALLPTFRRRIPMIINLPGLKERTIQERYDLVRAFFATECSSIGANIEVAPQVLRAFLLYDCPGNIGQLRSDIQLTCARAYLEYRTQGLGKMQVHLDTVPEHVRSGLLRTVELHRTLDAVAGQIEATHVFTPSGLNLNSLPGSAHDLYDSISTELTVLRTSGLNTDDINNLLHLDIQHYFQHFADSITQETGSGTAELVDAHIAETSHAIVQFATEQLARAFPEKMELVLALHITSALERAAPHRPLVEPSIPSMRYTYPREYAVAQTALLRIHNDLHIALPENEADVLTILFANADTLLSNEQASVGIVVAAHGRGIANGLADLVNTLVGINAVAAVELSLEQDPEELLTRVEQCVRRVDQGSGVLLLVDFASLLSLAELVSQRTGVQIRAVADVCAPLLVEAVRKAQQTAHITLDQLATSLAHFHALHNQGQVYEQAIAGERIQEQAAQYTGYPLRDVPAHGRVILSVCLTGFGSAMKMAELIEDRMPGLHAQDVDIICMDINLSGKTEDDIQQLVGDQQIVAIVGTINPHLENYPFISLTELLFGDGIARLRTLLGDTLIDPALLQSPLANTETAAPTFTRRSELIQEITYTLSQRLLFLNPTRILPLIERMIEMIEVEVGETFDIEVLAGLIVHLACVLEPGPQQQTFHVSAYVRGCVEQQFPRELNICRRAWQILSTQIARPLPDEEAYNIVGILRQVDIFMLNTP